MRTTILRTALLSLAIGAIGAMTADTALADHDRGRGRGHRDRGWDDDDRGRRVAREWSRSDQQRLLSLARRLEADTDQLARALDRALDDSRLDGSDREDAINHAASSLEDAADQVEDHVGDRADARRAVALVFQRADALDDLVGRRQLDAESQRAWQRVDADLDALASFFPAAARRSDDDRDRFGDDRGRNRGRGSWDWRESRPWLDDDRD